MMRSLSASVVKIVMATFIGICMIIASANPADSFDDDVKNLTQSGTWHFSISTDMLYESTKTRYEQEIGPSSAEEIDNFSVSTFFGYFPLNGLSLGPVLDYESNSTKNDEYDYSDESELFRFGAKARYYIETKSIILPFVQIKGAYVTGTSETKDPSSTSFDSDYDGTLFAAGGGIAVFVDPHVSLDLGFNYGIVDLNLSVSPDNGEEFDADVVNRGIVVALGASAYF